MVQLVILLSVVLFSAYQTEQAYFLEKSYIDTINQNAKTWKAGVNFDPSTPQEYIINKLGSIRMESPVKANDYKFKSHDDAYDKITIVPRTFDARKKWKNCTTIGKVRDQGNCASSWALGASSAFADRLCVISFAAFNQSLSAEELTFCCKKCGYGCGGGDTYSAWEFFNENGLVTGGDYNSGEGCEPYQVPPCPKDNQGSSSCAGKPVEDNHKCKKKCTNKNIDYKDDHKYTRNYFFLSSDKIQKELMTYGPVTASISVYDDLPSYKSGVYAKSDNASYLGGTAAKLIGWGKEEGTPYWLLMNSWGTQWGDKGLFKIKRGSNECGVEDYVTAGETVK